MTVLARLRAPIAAAAVLAATLAVGACGSGDQVAGGSGATPTTSSTGALAGKRITPPINASDFTFVDYSTSEAGTPFPLRAAPGTLLFTYFGYLSCPDICPTTMSDMSSAVKRLAPEDRAKVEAAFVTIDPERDTGPKVAGFVDHFFPDGGAHALVAGEDSTLWSATSRIGVDYKVDDHQPGDTSYGVAHTGYQYLIDDQGKVVWVWPYGTSSKDLAATLTALLHGDVAVEGTTSTTKSAIR